MHSLPGTEIKSQMTNTMTTDTQTLVRNSLTTMACCTNNTQSSDTCYCVKDSSRCTNSQHTLATNYNHTLLGINRTLIKAFGNGMALFCTYQKLLVGEVATPQFHVCTRPDQSKFNG